MTCELHILAQRHNAAVDLTIKVARLFICRGDWDEFLEMANKLKYDQPSYDQQEVKE